MVSYIPAQVIRLTVSRLAPTGPCALCGRTAGLPGLVIAEDGESFAACGACPLRVHEGMHTGRPEPTWER